MVTPDYRCNKRTFKKRVRVIIVLSIFITALIFTLIASAIALAMSRGEAELICSYFSISISKELNSPYFLKQMGIGSIEELDVNSPQYIAWAANYADSIKLLFNELPVNPDQPDASFTNVQFSAVKIIVEINGSPIFSSDQFAEGPADIFYQDIHMNPELADLDDKLSNVQSTRMIVNSRGEVAGSVKVVFQQHLLSLFAFAMISLFAAAALLSFLIALVVSRIFSRLVTSPLNQLEKHVSEVALADANTYSDVQLKLKKPLKEIQSIIQSTNTIMRRMQNNAKTLERQNTELDAQSKKLEAQKEELEAQNVQLALSKQQIEHAQTQLVQNANLASVGQLTAAITHEINTPLGAINSNCQMADLLISALQAEERILSNDSLAETAGALKQSNDISLLACKRVSEIIQSLKTFSRLDQAEFVASNLDENMKSVLVLTSNLWKNRIEIHTEFGINIPVPCYPGLINQVFMNLVVNAVQAIEGTGSIKINSWIEQESAYIAVQDSGCGILPEHLSKVFDMGFTTKAKSNGMGMGLSICKNIIDKHNGSLSVKSEPGSGALFLVRLPMVGQASRSAVITEE